MHCAREGRGAGIVAESYQHSPFLKAWVEKNGYESLKVFRVRGLRATVWTFDKNFEPKEYMDLS